MAASEKSAGLKSAGNRRPGGVRAAGKDEPIVAYNSPFKLVVLALPCIGFTIAGIYGAATGMSIVGGGLGMHLAIAGIAGMTSFVLLQMAFDRRPVLVIDEAGITCTRPAIGTVPWRAVAGIGISKAVLLRKVMMIAVEPGELDEKALRHANSRSGLAGMISPQIAHFEGKMAGRPTISIPIAYLSISSRKLQRLISDKISYHG